MLSDSSSRTIIKKKKKLRISEWKSCDESENIKKIRKVNQNEKCKFYAFDLEQPKDVTLFPSTTATHNTSFQDISIANIIPTAIIFKYIQITR